MHDFGESVDRGDALADPLGAITAHEVPSAL
jgi:hypothetical protein